MSRTAKTNLSIKNQGVLLGDSFTGLDLFNNISATDLGNGFARVDATGGGGGGGSLATEVPTGAVDGSNKTFTVVNTPIYIVVDGVAYFPNDGYTIVGTTITTSIAPSGFIESIYGSGVTAETPTGTVNGSNTSFTVTSTPKFIVVDGVTYFPNDGYTIVGLTITTTVPPSGFIISLF